ncbi:hypothetical protein DENSPDRAFT_405432 [Dentipellis sp. KUC8613]|nr:hypothetical protein DENSPDRAFT_405432 [Dentipellis sp. KUC8613]
MTYPGLLLLSRLSTSNLQCTYARVVSSQLCCHQPKIWNTRLTPVHISNRNSSLESAPPPSRRAPSCARGYFLLACSALAVRRQCLA